MMKRVGFMLKVRKDRLEEYKEHHRNVWPEMQAALKRCGWHNYSLFMNDDGLMFGYVETPEGLQAAIDAMGGEEINARWQAMMGPFFESLEGRAPDESMIEMTEVFHLE